MIVIVTNATFVYIICLIVVALIIDSIFPEFTKSSFHCYTIISSTIAIFAMIGVLEVVKFFHSK